MIIKTIKNIPGSEITDPLVFQQRRTLIKAMAAMMLTGTSIRTGWADDSKPLWSAVPKSPFSAPELVVTPAAAAKKLQQLLRICL